MDNMEDSEKSDAIGNGCEADEEVYVPVESTDIGLGLESAQALVWDLEDDCNAFTGPGWDDKCVTWDSGEFDTRAETVENTVTKTSLDGTEPSENDNTSEQETKEISTETSGCYFVDDGQVAGSSCVAPKTMNCSPARMDYRLTRAKEGTEEELGFSDYFTMPQNENSETLFKPEISGGTGLMQMMELNIDYDSYDENKRDEPFWCEVVRNKLPDETWALVAENVIDPAERYRLCKAMPFVEALYKQPIVDWLMPLVAPHLLPYLNDKEIYNVRETCRTWRESVDTAFLEPDFKNISGLFKITLKVNHMNFHTREAALQFIQEHGLADLENVGMYFSHCLEIDLREVEWPDHNRAWIEHLPIIIGTRVIQEGTRYIRVFVGDRQWNSLQIYFLCRVLFRELPNITVLVTSGYLIGIEAGLGDAIRLEVLANRLHPIEHSRELMLKIGEIGELNHVIHEAFAELYHQNLVYDSVDFQNDEIVTFQRCKHSHCAHPIV